MSVVESIHYDPSALALRRRTATRAAVGAARVLATQPPARIRWVLERLRRGTDQATAAEVQAARDAVVTVSLTCAGRVGCLPRSLATVLVCRAQGRWATWCLGARQLPPFAAHAWVEADGVPIGEDRPPDYFRAFLRV